jgi:hypothetical protein
MDDCNTIFTKPLPGAAFQPNIIIVVARKCHLQSTGLENKVSENRRWDGGLRGASTDMRGVSRPFRIVPKTNPD